GRGTPPLRHRAACSCVQIEIRVHPLLGHHIGAVPPPTLIFPFGHGYRRDVGAAENDMDGGVPASEPPRRESARHRRTGSVVSPPGRVVFREHHLKWRPVIPTIGLPEMAWLEGWRIRGWP